MSKLRSNLIRLASTLEGQDRKNVLALLKPQWKTVTLDASALAAAQGVKFVYLTKGVGGRMGTFARFEAHRYLNEPDEWAGMISRRGEPYNWRKARTYTTSQILRMFQTQGGGTITMEVTEDGRGGTGRAFVTDTNIFGG